MGSYTDSYSSYPTGTPIPIIHDVSFNEPIAKISFVGEAVIDTGADFSNIPGGVINQYRLTVRDYVSVELPDGTTKRCNVYILEVSVPGLATLTEKFVDYGFNEIILGRSILNCWRIILDPSHKSSSGPEIEIQD
jgi:predicted aspartyl protease